MVTTKRLSETTLLGLALAALGLIAGAAALVATWHPIHLRSGRFGYTILLLVAFAAWLVAIRIADSVRPWAVVAFVIGTAAATVAGPPQHLTDIYNYLGYARLGAVHHLSPYSHVIANELRDPVAKLTSWRDLSSPYGPLFTAITYPFALLPVSVGYWGLKVLTVLAAVATIGAVAWCAKLLGRDWRRPVVFIAANPIYVFYALNGFHNDFVMLLPSTLAIGLVISGRERSAGAAMAVAIAVKFTAIVLLPFLLVYAATDRGGAHLRGMHGGVRAGTLWPLGTRAVPAPSRGWVRVLVGAILATIPLIGLDVWLFGLSIPNLSGQSGLVTGYSIPNLLGLGLGVGGATNGLDRMLNLAVVIGVLCLLWRARNGQHWISGAAWATLGLTASIAWLMPWYIVWTLPLVALAETVWLRRTVAVATLFLLLTFAPYADTITAAAHINPMASTVGRAAIAYQRKLQGLVPVVPAVAPIPVPIAGVTEPRTVVLEAGPVLLEPRTVVPRPRRVVAEPQTVVAEPRTVVAEPRTVVAEPRRVVAEPRTVVAEPRTVRTEPRAVGPKPRTVVALTESPRDAAVVRAPRRQ